MSNIPLIFGTGVSAAKDYEGLLSVCRVAVANGIMAFDTAPSYKTERELGAVVIQLCNETRLTRQDFYLQTKIDPPQMLEGKKHIIEHVEKKLEEMNLTYFDGLLIHWPIPECFIETWKTMMELKKDGIVRNIGICNVRERQITNILSNKELEKPDIIQIERNPLNTCDEDVAICTQNGMKVQAYSALCKMHPDLQQNDILNFLSSKYQRGIGEIILRWHLDTGVTPIFTSKNMERIHQYASISDFSLDEEDVKKITAINRNYKMYLESWLCPGF